MAFGIDHGSNAADPLIGSLKAWYATATDGVASLTELPIEKCTRNELGLAEATGLSTGLGGTRFFKFDTTETSSRVEKYKDDLYCIK